MFENAKEGDKVLCTTRVKTSFWGIDVREFLIPAFVERTTKTQIIVSGIRFYRKDGREVTSRYDGAECIPFDEDKNQYKEYSDFKLKVNLRAKLRKLLENVNTSINGMENSEMQALIDVITVNVKKV